MTENVIFFLRVIPDLHMKPTVDNTADDKFKRCYYCTSGKATDNQTACFDFYVRYINNQQSGTSRNCHCPMGEATENDFDKAVNNSAE